MTRLQSDIFIPGVSVPFHQPVEYFRSFKASPFKAEGYAGQGGVGEQTEHFIIVDPKDGDIVGYVPAYHLASYAYQASAVVIAGKQAKGRGQALEPIRQTKQLHVGGIVNIRFGQIIPVRRQAQSLGLSPEILAAFFRPTEVGEATEGKMMQAAFPKVLNRYASDGVSVAHDVWKIWNGASGIDADHGYADLT